MSGVQNLRRKKIVNKTIAWKSCPVGKGRQWSLHDLFIKVLSAFWCVKCWLHVSFLTLGWPCAVDTMFKSVHLRYNSISMVRQWWRENRLHTKCECSIGMKLSMEQWQNSVVLPCGAFVFCMCSIFPSVFLSLLPVPAWWGCFGLFLTNQPNLPTPFYSVLVSISVFMAVSTVFHSINSPKNSALSHCFSSLISASLVLSTIYLFVKVSFSPDIIFCGWLGLKHQISIYLSLLPPLLHAQKESGIILCSKFLQSLLLLPHHCPTTSMDW